MCACVTTNQHFQTTNHFKSLVSGLNTLRQKAIFCDITIKIGSASFPAHRNVLAAACPYFHAMLTGGLMEEQKDLVPIGGVSSQIFELLLDFVYTGEIYLNQENCQDVLVAADMFNLPELVNFCAEYLQKQLHPSNCIGMYRFAESHACSQLKSASEAFIHNNFLQVTQEEEYLDIPKNTLTTFLQSENLFVESEYQVFTAAMKWILHHVSDRRKYVYEVLDNIRFPVISQKQIEQYISECPDLSLKIALTKMLNDMKDSAKLPYVLKISKLKPVLLYPRKCARKSLYVIGGFCRHQGGRWSDCNTLPVVEKFDSFGQIWRTVSPLDHPRSGHGVCKLNGLIYVIGGESDSLIFDTAQSFDPSTNKWTDIPCMTVPRCGLGVVATDDHIYAIGGWVGSEIGDSIEKYSPELNVWTKVDKLPTLRYAMGIVQYQGLIYIIGGLSDIGSEMRKIETYNPVTGEWAELADLQIPRAYAGTAVMDDSIFVVGGYNEQQGSLNTVEKFNISQNSWKELPPMSVARAGASVAAVNGLLYVIGGRTSNDVFVAPSTLSSVECYDPHTDTWIDVGNMPTSRCEAGIAVL